MVDNALNRGALVAANPSLKEAFFAARSRQKCPKTVLLGGAFAARSWGAVPMFGLLRRHWRDSGSF